MVALLFLYFPFSFDKQNKNNTYEVKNDQQPTLMKYLNCMEITRVRRQYWKQIDRRSMMSLFFSSLADFFFLNQIWIERSSSSADPTRTKEKQDKPTKQKRPHKNVNKQQFSNCCCAFSLQPPQWEHNPNERW